MRLFSMYERTFDKEIEKEIEKAEGNLLFRSVVCFSFIIFLTVFAIKTVNVATDIFYSVVVNANPLFINALYVLMLIFGTFIVLFSLAFLSLLLMTITLKIGNYLLHNTLDDAETTEEIIRNEMDTEGAWSYKNKNDEEA